MKKLIPFLFFLTLCNLLHAQVKSDDILGKWLSESGKAKIEVFKSGERYYGKIIWLKNPMDENGKPKTDKHNQNPDHRGHPLLGLLLLKSMEFNTKSMEWHNGTIYDPEDGKEYKCKITKGKESLAIRGYIGVSMIGRTTAWKKVD